MIISFEDVARETEQLFYLRSNVYDWSLGESESYPHVIDWVKPEMTAVGVFQWVTSQHHKPVNGEKFMITVEFKLDCRCMWKSNSNSCCSHEFNEKSQKSVFYWLLQRKSLYEIVSRRNNKKV